MGGASSSRASKSHAQPAYNQYHHRSNKQAACLYDMQQVHNQAARQSHADCSKRKPHHVTATSHLQHGQTCLLGVPDVVYCAKEFVMTGSKVWLLFHNLLRCTMHNHGMLQHWGLVIARTTGVLTGMCCCQLVPVKPPLSLHGKAFCQTLKKGRV